MTEIESHDEAPKTKRYPLVLPYDLWDKLTDISDRDGQPVLHIIRRYIEQGLQSDGVKLDVGVDSLSLENEETLEQRVTAIEQHLGINPPSRSQNPNL